MIRISGGAVAGLLLGVCVYALLSGGVALGGSKHEQMEALQHAPTDSASIAAGEKTYGSYCAPCHGVAGDGKGPTGAVLKPPPRDFRSPKNFKGENDGELFEVVKNGGASEKLSPLMPAWGGTLNKKQIWQVIAYIRGFPARDSLAKVQANAKK